MDRFIISTLLKGAKGKLNITDFAAKCGIGKSTMYKLMNGDIKSMPSDEILDAICENTDIDPDTLRQACNSVLEVKRDEFEVEKGLKQKQKNLQKISNLLASEYIDAGRTIKKLEEPDFDLVLEVDGKVIVFDIECVLSLKGTLLRLYQYVGKKLLDGRDSVSVMVICAEAEVKEIAKFLDNTLGDESPVNVVLIDDNKERIVGRWLHGPI